MEASAFLASRASCGRVLLFAVFLLCLLGRHGNCVAEPTASASSPGAPGTSAGSLTMFKVATAGSETEGTRRSTHRTRKVSVSEHGDEIMRSSAAATSEAASAGYPAPREGVAVCEGTAAEKAWICDDEGVLPQKQVDEIDELLAGLNANASCICNCSSGSNATLGSDEGYLLAAAVVRSIPGEDPSNSNRTYQLERFSDSLRQDWFADQLCDDSAVILMHFMYNCSKIHISLGKALSDLLPEGALSSIYEAARPSLESGDRGPAMALTVRRLAAALEEASRASPPPDNLVWGILGVLAISSILLFHYWIKY